MKTLLNPKWLILIHHLPVLILFLLMYSNFRIFHTQLDESTIELWYNLGAYLGSLALLNIGYSIWLIAKRQALPLFYSFIVLATYTPLLAYYYIELDEIIPRNIPNWMLSNDLHYYVGTFLMPSLIHALFTLVVRSVKVYSRNGVGYSFLIALLIPAVWYMFMQLVFPLWSGVDRHFTERFMVVLSVLVVMSFLFFLIRLIYLIAIKRRSIFEKNQLWWKIPITILFPLFGLALNNGLVDGRLSIEGGGVFGRFNAPIFYILAILNGLLLCLPDWQNKLYRLPLFVGRGILFGYTFYFFLVFLPFLPLSVFAILVFGAGFLMLTPLALFVIHIDQLRRDWQYLQGFYSKRVIWAMTLSSMLLLPIIIHVSYWRDRTNLERALAYVYNPDYEKEYQVNRRDLGQTLNALRWHKDGSRDWFMEHQLPFLSAYYNWLVLDNMTISDRKLDRLSAIFFDAPYYRTNNDFISRTENFDIPKLEVESQYDVDIGLWKSWVHLEIQNDSLLSRAEFATSFKLPENTWISNYYLDVFEERKYGLLVEKKSALWVYNQIRSRRRDPGLLYYLNNQTIAFRVFPFSRGELRKTGIQFIHAAPIELELLGSKLDLGQQDAQQDYTFDSSLKGIQWLGQAGLKALDTLQRQPYFHFIIDLSKSQEGQLKSYEKEIEQLVAQYPALGNEAQISLCNIFNKSETYTKNWTNKLGPKDFKGGFFLERAIKAALVKHHQNPSDRYPVFVALTNQTSDVVLDKDFSDLAFTYPDKDVFYLAQKGEIQAHSLWEQSAWPIENMEPMDLTKAVRIWPNTKSTTQYISKNAQTATVQNRSYDPNDLANWQTLSLEAAVTQQVFQRHLQLHPENYEKGWIRLLRSNFQTGIMGPLSSYMVVENAAQEAMLLKKQQQVIKGNANLDLEEEEDQQRSSMSGPGIWVMVVLALGLIFLGAQSRA
ncbi:MAG: MSEP-CTERM sorting domain-containing protein [Bacteroidota bacterium]